MKSFLIAVAIVTAAPAFAQTAAPADPHAGHGAHGAHGAKDPHAGHTMPDGKSQADPHAGHDMGDCCRDEGGGTKECCKAMAAKGGKASCCADKKLKPAADPHASRGTSHH